MEILGQASKELMTRFPDRSPFLGDKGYYPYIGQIRQIRHAALLHAPPHFMTHVE
jgi:hypothetical protein